MPMLRDSHDGSKATSVIVADFSRMDCQLLTDTIRRQKSFRVVGCAVSSTEAISGVCKSQPHIALVSTRLQDGFSAGLLVIQKLHTLQSGSRAVLLLDDDDPDLVVEAFRSGARGVFCRTGTSAELRKCLQCVRNGQIWTSNVELEYIVAALMRAPATRFTKGEATRPLSPREEEVACLVAGGLSNLEISEKLGLSKHTVKNHLFRVFEKLDISTRVGLVLYILSQAKPPKSEEGDQVPQFTDKVSA